ncbi:MAG: adenine phosphoribosyltransferase [Anaerolineales bacterium]
MNLMEFIPDVPDFPIEGVLFKDITPLLSSPDAFREAVDLIVAEFEDKEIAQVVAIESRGFIFGAPVAYQLGCGFVPIRKPEKLPREKISVEYSLEYGTNILEMHADAIGSGENVLLVDDLLATGGSAEAAVALIERLGGKVTGIAFLIELAFLRGREKLKNYDIFSIMTFE